MRYGKWMIWAGLAAAVAVPASADEWYGRDRDLGHDYARVERMRADIARDRARLDRDIRRGNRNAASRDAADLARDQRALDAQLRDVRHDRRDWR